MFHLDLANVSKVRLTWGQFERVGEGQGKKGKVPVQEGIKGGRGGENKEGNGGNQAEEGEREGGSESVAGETEDKSVAKEQPEEEDGGDKKQKREERVPREGDEKEVVVVSVFGSTLYQLGNSGGRRGRYKRAFQLVMDAFGTVGVYKEGGEEVGEDNPGKGNGEERNLGGKLEGFLNEDESILFLHLEDCAYDAAACMEALQTLHSAAIKESGFLSVWSTLNTQYCRWLLLLFSLSHVMLLSEPGGSLDTSYISLFRALDRVRQDCLPTLAKILATIEGLPKGWVDHARLCSPRLIFLFEVESPALPQKSNLTPITSSLPSSSAPTHINTKERKELLQNEIYQIFRKCRIITNISANSLFAVPATDDFIYVFDRAAQNTLGSGGSPSSSLAYTYLHLISNSKNPQCPSTALTSSYTSKIPQRPPLRSSFRLSPTTLTYSDTVHHFRNFLGEHLNLAKLHGFDDDYRRVSGSKHFFVRPTLHHWILAFEKLHSFLVQDPQGSKRISDCYIQMDRFINVNSEYLEFQCADLFPKVFMAYQRGLPEYYTGQQHQQKLTYSMNLFLNISRGPVVIPWLKKLAQKCEKYWKNGRQQCETLSLLGHVCSQPVHRVRRKDHLEIVPLPEDMDPELPELSHASASKLVSYCNCGKRQGSREEPFTIRQANYDWYRRQGRDCCDKLESYTFSVFSPMLENPAGTSDEPGDLSGASGISLQDMIVLLQRKKESLGGTTNGGENGGDKREEEEQGVFEAELRQEDTEDDEEEEDEEILVEELRQESDEELSLQKREKGLFKRHSSTVEYLPGMYHSKSPLGLLPLFPSWSLVCLGSSSIYSHSHGVSQHGFVNGANCLLPWDVKVKAEKGVTYKPPSRLLRDRRRRGDGCGRPRREILVSSHLPAGVSTGGGGTSSDKQQQTDEFSVKVFFGFEYECRKGHRFFGDKDEKVLYALNISQVTQKQIAGKVIASDMPLYVHCPCKENRDSKQIAQLIRVHIVTPKAPVFVTVQPKIQPGPGAPIFTPSPPSSSPEEDADQIGDIIKLTPSTYWVLRVPFSYVGDVVYVPPSQEIGRYNGKLLKGMLNVVSMNNEETQEWKFQNQNT